MGVRRRAAALLLAALPLAAGGAAAQGSGPASPTGARDLRVHEMRSRTFGNARSLRVLLPPGYDLPENRGRRYPVLYLNDGQNLFDSTTATFNPMEWRVDETVARLVADGTIPPLVVVGIDHAGRRERAHEYLPFPDEYLDPPDPRPAGARYPDFLVSEVLPFVESRYRVRRDGAGRALGGSSYGALAALYAVAMRPGVFGALLLESPSLYVSGARVLEVARRSRALPGRVYVGVGTNEMGRPACAPSDDGGEAVSDVRKLEALLRERGTPASAIRVVVEPCAVHDENAWARRLPGALGFLFGGPR